MTRRSVIYALGALALAAAACSGDATTETSTANPPTSEPAQPPAAASPAIGPGDWSTFRLVTSRIGAADPAAGEPERAWTFDTGG